MPLCHWIPVYANDHPRCLNEDSNVCDIFLSRTNLYCISPNNSKYISYSWLHISWFPDDSGGAPPTYTLVYDPHELCFFHHHRPLLLEACSPTQLLQLWPPPGAVDHSWSPIRVSDFYVPYLFGLANWCYFSRWSPAFGAGSGRHSCRKATWLDGMGICEKQLLGMHKWVGH